MQVGDAGLAALCEYGVTRRLRSLSLEQTNVTNWGGTAILELRGSLGHTDCGHDLLDIALRDNILESIAVTEHTCCIPGGGRGAHAHTSRTYTYPRCARALRHLRMNRYVWNPVPRVFCCH